VYIYIQAIHPHPTSYQPYFILYLYFHIQKTLYTVMPAQRKRGRPRVLDNPSARTLRTSAYRERQRQVYLLHFLY